jgi:glycine C-acetyltransferase/8-amino-7-oxononanoate synthase
VRGDLHQLLKPMSADLHLDTPLGPRVVIAGRERDYFSGTGYLGLHNHALVRQAAAETIARYGMATGTSRGGYGEHPVYEGLEAEARAFFGTERVLYYPSGYLSGTILAQGLRERYERIFIDDWAHYSLWDGARVTGKPVAAFRHMDAGHLAELLRDSLGAGERPLVLSDGVFPISGEIAPGMAYREALSGYAGAWLVLDDAHATGVLGAHGRGTLEHFGVEDDHCAAGHTLSKGIGGYGGLIAGRVAFVEEIARGTRVYVGSSPPPLPVAAAARQALALAREDGLREQLRANVALARAGLRGLGWALDDTPVPVICLGARKGMDLGKIKEALFERDVCVAHVTGYSSTPTGGALRIAIFASHSSEQIERLVAELSRLV